VKVSSLKYGEDNEIIGFNRATGTEDTTLIYINQEDCIRCNACVEACPVDAISVQCVNRYNVRPEDMSKSSAKNLPSL
jgi:NAD-dependent dihydropyrimidine dehydrogenase PreA subunit